MPEYPWLQFIRFSTIQHDWSDCEVAFGLLRSFYYWTPEINPTSYLWPWLIGFIWAKICIDCKEERGKMSGEVRLSYRSMSCSAMGVQSNPFVSKTCLYVVLSFLTCTLSHACRYYMFYQWRARVVCIRMMRVFMFCQEWGYARKELIFGPQGFLGT